MNKKNPTTLLPFMLVLFMKVRKFRQGVSLKNAPFSFPAVLGRNLAEVTETWSVYCKGKVLVEHQS